MKSRFADFNIYSTNLSLKIFSIGLFLMMAVALFVPATRSFVLGMALSWSGILAWQIFTLPALPDAEPVDRDPTIQLHLS